MFCEVCHGDEFDESDGHFFCTTCLTQSQDIRVEEEDSEYVTNFNVRLQVKVKSSHKKEKEVLDKGRPWHTYEAFQIILLEQVKTFIKLGADPKLKDVVFRLWCNFLHKTGVAFPENLDIVYLQRHREKYPGTISNPQIDSKEFRETWRKNHGFPPDGKHNKQDLQASLMGEEFYDEDNPVSEDEEYPVEEEAADGGERSDYQGESKGRTQTRVEDGARNMKGDKKYSEVKSMFMLKTLCFCYIGLIYCKSMVSPSDIVRWVSECKIPYYKATKLLPADMKFSVYDWNTFGSCCSFKPKISRFLDVTSNLARFLDLPVGITRHQAPVSLLMNKFLIKMELPSEMHRLVQTLWRKVTLNVRKIKITHTWKHKLEDNEMIAMTYIILTIQLLFALDDYTENEISKYAKQLESQFKLEGKLFIWENWIKLMDKHISHNISNPIHPKFNPNQVKDITQFLQQVRLGQKEVSKAPLRNKKTKSQNPDLIHAILQPLKQLEQRMLEKDQESYVKFRGAQNDGQQDKPEHEHSQSFRSQTLCYITHPEQFIGGLQGNEDHMDTTNSSSVFVQQTEEQVNYEQVLDRLLSLRKCLNLSQPYPILTNQSASYRFLILYASQLIETTETDLHNSICSHANLLNKDLRKVNFSKKDWELLHMLQE